ncbi:MAG: isocitrate lyase/phosphoenolpyruvate mutase family protein [Beijerinckiaceae bacterium]|nr:isocitrate lyase/phosphoenolpyruvate mutase family protein [Beijerinckiaceae bacterium]
MKSSQERRAALRLVLAGDACIHPASVHDPISARIAAEIGFEAGMLAGSVASLSVLGAPDFILLTLSEFAETARRIGRGCDLPLICDADHGYGNALNVMRTVEELETAGVAGMTIEDTILPRPFGVDRIELISKAEGVAKMKAAVAARMDPTLCIFARTSALGPGGMEEALERVRAYQPTGVDGVFVTGVKTRADVEALAQAARLPLLLGGVPKDILDRAFLGAHGVRVALQGHQPFAAAVAAISSAMRALRDGSEMPQIASTQTMDRLTRTAQWSARTKTYLTPDD